MSVTVASLVTNLDTYFGDSSTDRVSQAERFQALSESTVWLLESLGNDHNIKTYELNFFDTINYYKITSSVSDLLASADLRRSHDNQTITANHKSSREMAEAIGKGSREFAWAIERRDGNSFVAITLNTSKTAKRVTSFDSLTDGGGTWEADTTNSDATNVTQDVTYYTDGSASLNFDVDVSQSANNKATIQNTALNTLDLTAYNDIGSWLLDVYIPDATTVTSYTIYWGTDTSNYWSATVTSDRDGATLADGDNVLQFDWNLATATGSPDMADIEYIAIQLNYSAGQIDDTDFRLDNLRIANPEKLKYHYLSWDLGTDTNGTAITTYTATTDVPFYSGQYDQYRYAVAHKAASILFYSLRLREEGQSEEREAMGAVSRLLKLFPISKSPESHSFKVSGLNFNRNRRRTRYT